MGFRGSRVQIPPSRLRVSPAATSAVGLSLCLVPALVLRAPPAKLQPYKRRMGWNFPLSPTRSRSGNSLPGRRGVQVPRVPDGGVAIAQPGGKEMKIADTAVLVTGANRG